MFVEFTLTYPTYELPSPSARDARFLTRNPVRSGNRDCVLRRKGKQCSFSLREDILHSIFFRKSRNRYHCTNYLKTYASSIDPLVFASLCLRSFSIHPFRLLTLEESSDSACNNDRTIGSESHRVERHCGCDRERRGRKARQRCGAVSLSSPSTSSRGTTRFPPLG